MDGTEHTTAFQYVEGCPGRPYRFGDKDKIRAVEVADFYISATQVTQDLWSHVMGAANNPSHFRGGRKPVENCSWGEITRPGGFLSKANKCNIPSSLLQQIQGATAAVLRLPTETEWEYAARGGVHWTDGYVYSGGNDIEPLAWYERNSGKETHEVASKAPNQLGIYDMCGNVWEWCQDTHTTEIGNIPIDGGAHSGPGVDRILRGGCHHNWAIHCTVSKRYEIAHNYRDECIGFRVVLDVMRAAKRDSIPQ
ncbi:MAG: formylglycine-generating enzyme family protein [Planctomycetes bacterium]|nr:formylglycine-generating enzyme family protein [Planctomycetota bacterium]